MNRIIICVALVLCCCSLDCAARPNFLTREVPAELKGLRKDLDKLNKWLTQHKISPYAPDELLSAINEKLLNSFKWNLIGGDPKRAGKYLIKVSRMADECTDETLEMLRQLNNVIRRAYVPKAADFILDYYANKMALNCRPKIKGKFDELIKQLGSKQFVRQLQPVNLDSLGQEAYRFHDQEIQIILTTHLRAKLVRAMAGDDPRNVYARVTLNHTTGETETVLLKENFDQVYEDYLVKPCNEFETTPLKDLIESVVAIGYFTLESHQKDSIWAVNRPYFGGLPMEIQNYLQRFYFCRTVLDKRFNSGGFVFDFLRIEDQSKSNIKILRKKFDITT